MRDVDKLEEAQQLFDRYEKMQIAVNQDTLRKMAAARKERPSLGYRYQTVLEAHSSGSTTG